LVEQAIPQLAALARLRWFESLHVLQRDILRRSRRRVRSDVTLVTDAMAAFGSDGMTAAATNARCSRTPPKHWRRGFPLWTA